MQLLPTPSIQHLSIAIERVIADKVRQAIPPQPVNGLPLLPPQVASPNVGSSGQEASAVVTATRRRRRHELDEYLVSYNDEAGVGDPAVSKRIKRHLEQYEERQDSPCVYKTKKEAMAAVSMFTFRWILKHTSGGNKVGVTSQSMCRFEVNVKVWNISYCKNLHIKGFLYICCDVEGILMQVSRCVRSWSTGSTRPMHPPMVYPK
jgi:hypothetical protein